MSSGVVIYHRVFVIYIRKVCVCAFFLIFGMIVQITIRNTSEASLLSVERKVAWKRKTNGSLLCTGELIWRRLWCCVHSRGSRFVIGLHRWFIHGSRVEKALRGWCTLTREWDTELSFCPSAGCCTGSHSNLCALPSEMRLQIPCGAGNPSSCAL